MKVARNRVCRRSLSLVTAYEPARALNANVTTLRVVCPAAIVNAAKDHNHR